jgi:hypothetical protein
MTDIMFLTHNRLEFTRASLGTLLEHTNPRLVGKLSFFDDRSSDGVLQLLQDRSSSLPFPCELRQGSWCSPVDAMAEFFRAARGPLVAKIDSDVMLPPGWLSDCEQIMATHPEIDVLGIEARGQSAAESAPFGVHRDPDPAEWIGGIGVFRLAPILAAMERVSLSCDRRQGKWFGWGDFQQRAELRVAWIKPSLQVFLLDRMPMDPWRSLSDEYAARGWQRPAPYRYGPEWAGLWDWWRP